MLDIQQKRKFRNVMYHRVTLSLLGIVVLLGVHSTWRVYTKKSESVLMKQASEARVNSLSNREREIDDKINKLATVSGVEEEIRAKFSVAKERENMVIIVREESTTSEENHEKRGFWAKFKALFE